MKRFEWWLIGLVVAVLVLGQVDGVKAAPMQFYGTPMFYGKYTEPKQPCVFNKAAAYGYCGGANTPEVAVIGFTDPTEPTSGFGLTTRLLTEVICVAGKCASNFGEPMGRIKSQTTSYWTIPTGYYLASNDEEQVAYQQGTGPLAEEFPRYPVKEIPTLQDPPRGVARYFNDGLDRYEVYCNKALECSYMGQQLMASDLPRYIPKVMTYNCGKVFCYHADKTIAGLNPKRRF